MSNPYETPRSTDLKTPSPLPLWNRRAFVLTTVALLFIATRAGYLLRNDLRSGRGFEVETVAQTILAIILFPGWIVNFFILPVTRRRRFVEYIKSEMLDAEQAYEEFRFDHCIERLTNIIQVSPIDEALFCRGMAYWYNGDYASALSDLERAIQVETPNVFALGQLANLLATAPVDEIRDGTRAEVIAKQALEMSEPNDSFLLAVHAAALAEQQRFEEAISVYQKSMANAPAKSLEHSAESLAKLKQRLPLRACREKDLARLKKARQNSSESS